MRRKRKRERKRERRRTLMRSERVNVCRSVLFCVHAAILFVWMCKERERERQRE